MLPDNEEANYVRLFADELFRYLLRTHADPDSVSFQFVVEHSMNAYKTYYTCRWVHKTHSEALQAAYRVLFEGCVKGDQAETEKT